MFFFKFNLDQWATDTDYNEENEVPLVSVYRKNEIPERYHWKDSRFISPIVLVARPGTFILEHKIAININHS